jgi:hypothetical protein
MPNGKGCLECSYCAHYEWKTDREWEWQGHRVIAHYTLGEGRCSRWRAELPSTASGHKHRVCRAFRPNEVFAADNRFLAEHHGQTLEDVVQLRMSWFGRELEEGKLYVFGYNYPPGIEELMDLKSPEGADSS